MDVEGAELQVVEGEHRLFAGTARPVVVFEANEANCAAFGHCVFDLLRRFDKVGYSLIQLDNEDWCATLFSPAQRMIQGNEPYALCTGSWN